MERDADVAFVVYVAIVRDLFLALRRRGSTLHFGEINEIFDSDEMGVTRLPVNITMVMSFMCAMLSMFG